jgi:Lysyl-tRNA synthetase (class II)
MSGFYWAYATLYDLMDLTEELFSTIATGSLRQPDHSPIRVRNST